MSSMNRLCKLKCSQDGGPLISHFSMLDEFGTEIEHADSRLDATMKKMAKVLHLSDGK